MHTNFARLFHYVFSSYKCMHYNNIPLLFPQ